MTQTKPWFVYIIQTVAGQLYTGISNDIQRRWKEHYEGKKGARFFHRSPPKAIVYLEEQADRSSASKREAAIKKLSRTQKLALIDSYTQALDDKTPSKREWSFKPFNFRSIPTMKLYQHPRCTTCKKAVKYLESLDLTPESIDITEIPPTEKELREMLAEVKEIRKLFNTSGQRYRELGLKDKLSSMSEKEALDLLKEDGMLVKRPFLIGDGVALVGFREPVWDKALRAS